jgi:hypothetical protein
MGGRVCVLRIKQAPIVIAPREPNLWEVPLSSERLLRVSGESLLRFSNNAGEYLLAMIAGIMSL